jgi:hypothetical protein
MPDDPGYFTLEDSEFEESMFGYGQADDEFEVDEEEFKKYQDKY